MSFIDDIQGQNTQLYPIVTIEPPDAEDREQYVVLDTECLFISTNNVSLDHIHSLTNTGESRLYGRSFKPLLLNIPSIKESIDIESRKFKISNVSLDISNIEYEGKRFTDILSDTSLINWKVSIQFVSPSAKHFSTMFGVQGYSGYGYGSFYEAYNTLGFATNTFGGITFESGALAYTQDKKDKMTQMVYQGIIRRISHDDTKVKVELEDLTEQKAHKNLPSENLGELGVIDKYKNKPIPMVYGHVDRSPLVLKDNYSKIQADYKDIKKFVEVDSGFNKIDGVGIWLDSLQMEVDGTILNVRRGGQYQYVNNYIELLPSVLNPITAEDVDLVHFVCRGLPNKSISITNEKEDASLVNEDFLTGSSDINNINAMSDGDMSINAISTTSTRMDSDSFLGGSGSLFLNIEYLLLSIDLSYSSQYDTLDEKSKIIGFQINGRNLPKLIHSLVDGYTENAVAIPSKSMTIGGQGSDWITGTSEHYDMFHAITDSSAPHYSDLVELFNVQYDGQDINPNADITLKAYQNFDMPSNVTISENQGFIILFVENDNSLRIQFRVHTKFYGTDNWLDLAMQLDIDGDINEINVLVETKPTKPFSKNFYANVKGRIQTFDDHPDAAGITQYDDDLIENPIDIIYDLVRSELGHNAINEAEYKEAKDAHLGWKFGFTVNKKINSKKLIEDIAKSTKCFPKFKNDGTFGFNSIKDSYTVSNIVGGVDTGDYNTAHLIKESEVISYSFKKTKPEQIVSEVGIQYKKDYAQDSYLKDVFNYIGTQYGYTKFDSSGNEVYYGIDDPEDAYLEFESDYIRNDDTAHKLREFLFEHNRNDHLIFNLKLPLQYINLEIGDLVKFRDLFNGVKAYGIDYRRIEQPNGQYYYPLFMVTATTKNLDSVSIECMQLHLLWPAKISDAGQELWLDGLSIDTEGEVTDPNTEGLFYFPDADTIVITDVDVTPFEITAPVITYTNGDAILTPLSFDTIESGTTITLGSVKAVDGDQDTSDITNQIEITTSLGQTFQGGGSYSLGDFGVEYTTPEQILVTYTAISPNTGLSSSVSQIININVAELAPTVTIEPKLSALAEGSINPESISEFSQFTHRVSIVGNEGVDYFEKYVYNVQTAEIDYSATDPNELDLTNSVEFGEFEEGDFIGGNPIDIFADAQSFFAGGMTGHKTYYPKAFVYDSSGLYHLQFWTLIVSPEITSEATLLGDANLDGGVDVLDLATIMLHMLGQTTLTGQALANADINQDGVVDILDIVGIVQEILN